MSDEIERLYEAECAQIKLWYYTTDPDGGVWYGRCSSREDAVLEGRDEHEGEDYYVAWAVNDPVRLADWIDADRLLEGADEALADNNRVSAEYDDPPFFEVTPDQEQDLIARVQRACDEWQAAHQLVFTVNTFSAMGKPEFIKADGEATA